MRRRRRNLLAEIKLTPEGWVYLVVLIFITVGAVLRNVNLLIFMAGMMYATLLINWRLGLRRLRSLRATRRVPSRIHASQSCNIQWTCENKMAGVAAWNVIIEDRIERLADSDQTPEDLVQDQKRERWIVRWFGEVFSRLRKKPIHPFRAEAKVGFMRVDADQSEVESYRMFMGNRGKYIIGPASISTTFPFGLIVSRVLIPQSESIFVGPQIGQLDAAWERRVQSTATGSEAIKRRRAIEEDEFYALRRWRSGDSKKNIHWRTTAKYGEPIVKQHDQPNNRDFGLVLDLYSKTPDLPVDADCEKALSFAATAVLKMGSAVQGQVAVGICGIDSEICHSRSRKSVAHEVMKRLAVAQHSGQPRILDAILEVSNLVSAGTPVYVVSSRQRPLLIDLAKHSQGSWEQETNGASIQREQKRLERRLKQIEPLIRWIEVESDEFNRMFQMESAAQTIGLEKLQSKWANDARY